jgi:asparagine synthase (glutamine-hydrolysing)
MISDVPFGTFLSGGIDSSVVTAIAQSLSDEPIKTFSIGIEGTKQNESGYAQDVASYLKTSHHPFTVRESDAIEMVEKLDEVYDEPFSDTSFIPTMIVSRLARKHVTMVLSGDGGDELFFGYGAYLWASRLNNPLISAFKSPLSYLLQKGHSRHKRIAEMINVNKAGSLQSHIFSQEQNMFAHHELKKILNKEFHYSSEINVESIIKKRKLSASENQAFFDLSYYLPDDLLVKVDRATMHYSLEARVPLLDYRIVEFALNLDQNLKIKDNQMKYLLKEVLYDYVPKSYFDRPKWGFSVPMHKWLKNDLKFLVEKYVTQEMCNRYELINWDYAKWLLNQFYANNDDRLYNRIWLIVCLHRFMESNF